MTSDERERIQKIASDVCDLIDEGILIRDISKDENYDVFMQQCARIVKVLIPLRALADDEVGLKMKLWLLNRKGEIGWDENQGFVIRAASELDARIMASSQRGDEDSEVWIHEEESDCEELTTQGPVTVILRDFHAG